MILIDTSGLLAAVDPRQAHHAEAKQILVQPQLRILSPFVLAELDYLITSRAGQSEALKLLRDVGRGVYQLEPVAGSDIMEAITIVERYAGLQIGLTDASIVVLAKRFDCRTILTLDQRHFRAILGPKEQPFRLLPSDASVDEP